MIIKDRYQKIEREKKKENGVGREEEKQIINSKCSKLVSLVLISRGSPKGIDAEKK